MPNKYIALTSGQLAETEAAATSAGAGDAGEIVALNGSGKLDATLMPDGVGADVSTVVASEALSAGDFVNIYDATGTKCRKADATDATKPAHGFVKSAVEDAANASVYFSGTNDEAASGMTPGTIYYLSAATAGQETTTPPTGTGKIVQEIGFAKSATEIVFRPRRPVTLA